MSKPLRWLPLLLIALAAFWLRTHELARRPMHADEANQAVKTGELLETGRYAFDPRDHHGPSLYYLALPFAWACGERTLASLQEKTVRLLPAVFGTASVVLLSLLALPLGRWPAFGAAAFLALSPPSVYYSRYFIQETLLVTFTLATLLAARAWWRTGRLPYAALAGLSVGLMQATKASAPLFLAAAALAAWLAVRLTRTADSTTQPTRPASLRSARVNRNALLAFALSFVFTLTLFYSSFFSHFAGLRDAVSAYTHALTRFGAEAAPTGHEKPWFYYLKLFGWQRSGGLVWHQIVFSALAVVGFVVVLVSLVRRSASRDPLLVFAAVFTFLIVGAFSFFAYKTPWHAVHFVPGLALLAAGTLTTISRLHTGRPVAVAFALITLATLFPQMWRVSFLRPAEARNPYAYVHSSPDVLKIRTLVDAALARRPSEPVRIVSEEYWPIPWYLRGLPQVGYWSTPPDACDGALVITSMAQAESVRARFTRRYRESILGLRPGFLCVVFTPEDGEESPTK